MSTIYTTSLASFSGASELGQSLDRVDLLRLDLQGGEAPGNKAFKLRANLEIAKNKGVSRIVSFGGPWSNHLHALAAVGAELGIETIAIVRGGERETAMLADIRRLGMKLITVSREEYRRRTDPDYQEGLEQRFSPCVLVPEGAANPAGVLGCVDIAKLINKQGRCWRRVVVPVGTGTTLAGLAAGLSCAEELVGVSALKGANDLEQRITGLLAESSLSSKLPWHILHDHHCGGFARVNDRLRTFMTGFEQVHGVQLEPVYTGKMLLAIHSQIACGLWDRSDSILAIHTGGLQGRRGYSWLG
ncbi:MAG: pyridoxal-phosphate dependent enzyme [Halioglobus sp.]